MEQKTIKIANELFILSTSVVSAFSYLVACLFLKINPTLTNFLAITIFTAALNSFNSYFDIAEDMLSKPTRPLPSLKIDPKKILISTFILLIFSVLLSYENFSSFKIMIGWGFLAVLYSVPPIRLKKIPVLNTSLIASNYTILPWLLAWSQTSLSFPFIPVAILFIIAFGSVISKDFEDERADTLLNNKTIPVLFGGKKAIFIIRVLTIGGVFLLMFYLLTYSFIASLFGIPALITYIYITRNLKKCDNPKLSNNFMIAGAMSLVPLMLI